MTASRVQCSAAPMHRDRHMATDRQYHLTDPEGRQFAFCSGCCLLTYAVHGALPADAQNSAGTAAGDTTNVHARGEAA